jgi:hypothetical protein
MTPEENDVAENLPNYDDDPIFIKKEEEFLKALKEAPLPDFIAKKIIKPE